MVLKMSNNEVVSGLMSYSSEQSTITIYDYESTENGNSTVVVVQWW